MSGYTKLFGSILASTVWELPLATKVVWITMLAMADRHGEVQASVPGLAKFAGVTREQCEAALEAFLAPDPDSRTQDADGRRIEAIDGGWRLINHEKYSQQLSAEDRRERGAERQRRYADKQKRQQASAGVSNVSSDANDDTQTQTHPKTQTKTDPDRIPPAERVTSEKPIEPNQFEQALAVYGRTWQARYHRPYEPTPPDKSHLGRWWSKAALWQREQWPQIVSRYVGNTEAFFVKRTSSHSLTWLVTKGINEFTGPPPPSKEAIAAAELERHRRVRASERSAGPGDLFGLIGNLTDGKSLAPEEDEEVGRARAAAQMRARGVT